MRSVIPRASGAGIQAIVDQQFEVGSADPAAGLVIVEPEVDIHSRTKPRPKTCSKRPPRGLDKLLAHRLVISSSRCRKGLTFTPTHQTSEGFEGSALSGGYSRQEGNERLRRNHRRRGQLLASARRRALPSDPMHNSTPVWIPPFGVSMRHPSPEVLARVRVMMIRQRFSGSGSCKLRSGMITESGIVKASDACQGIVELLVEIIILRLSITHRKGGAAAEEVSLSATAPSSQS